jgi:hypothetical protein
MRKMGYQVVPQMMPKPNQNWELVKLQIKNKKGNKIEIQHFLE